MKNGNRSIPRIVYLFLIVLAGSMAYATIFQAPFVLDDGYIIGIGQTGSADILLHGGTRRFADLTFRLNYLLHGQSVVGYHITNLLIHLGSALMLFLLAETALAALGRTAPPPFSGEAEPVPQAFIPLAAALLFVVHPLQTQAVTYTIQRYTSLATLMYLASCWAYLRARISAERNEDKRHVALMSGVCVVCGVLALASKQIAATLPAMLLVLEIWLLGGKVLTRRFLAVAAACLAVTTIGMLAFSGWSVDTLLQTAQQFRDDQFFPRETYLLNQIHVVARYLGLLFVPIGQSLFHDPRIYFSLTDIPVLSSLLLHICLWFLVWIFFRHSRATSAEDHWEAPLLRLASLGIVWFYLALTVESSIIPIRHIMVEHRVYLPSAGFFLTLVSAMLLLVRRFRLPAVRVWIALGVTVVVLTGLAVARNRVWSDTLTLWQDAVSKAPDNSLARVNLGIDYFQRSRPEEALTNLMRALELNGNLLFNAKPPLAETLQQLRVDETRYSTGKELLGEGRVRIDGEMDAETGKRYASAMSNALGIAYEYRGDAEQARQKYVYALSLDPANNLAWYNLGLLAYRAGDTEQAVNAYLQLKSRNPDLAARLSAAMRPAASSSSSPR